MSVVLGIMTVARISNINYAESMSNSIENTLGIDQ